MALADFVLQAFMADNDASDVGALEVPIELNESRLLTLQREPGNAPQSTYRWSLNDASLIGIPLLEAGDAAKVFAVALSMQSWRVLHSPVILNNVSTLRVTTGSAFSGHLSTVLRSVPIVIHEEFFLAAARGLQAAFALPTPAGAILQEAINSYWDALLSVHTRSRFISLWSCFERAVNHDGVGRSGQELDRHANAATGKSEVMVERLRHLNNGLKHAKTIVSLPPDFAKQASSGSREVKELADRALADRLGIALPDAYGP